MPRPSVPSGQAREVARRGTIQCPTELEASHEATHLPGRPDAARVDAWLVHASTTAWESAG